MPRGRTAIDMTGQVFGRLTVIARAGSARTSTGTKALWRCQCLCGTERIVRRTCLISGNTGSCGCLGAELRRGEAHTASKLTENDVLEIRRRAIAGEGQRPLGRAFGISHSVIRDVATGKAWRHVA